MGKTNWILLALGVAAAVMLSMFMQHLMRVTKDNKQSPVVREIVAIFGSRMYGEASLKVDTNDGKRCASLKLRPLTGVEKQRVAREVGEFLWRRIGASEQLDRVEVHCIDEIDGSVSNHDIVRPVEIALAHVASRPSSQARSGTPPRPVR